MRVPLFVEVLPPKAGRRLSDVYVYLPTGGGRHVQYRFAYTLFPPRPELGFSDRRKNTDNADFYRISEAYVGRLEGESFTPEFRALQYGEIGLAFIEEGAGDYVGGFHGDECAFHLSLSVDGHRLSLSEPSFTEGHEIGFFEFSYIMEHRCCEQ